MFHPFSLHVTTHAHLLVGVFVFPFVFLRVPPCPHAAAARCWHASRGNGGSRGWPGAPVWAAAYVVISDLMLTKYNDVAFLTGRRPACGMHHACTVQGGALARCTGAMGDSTTATTRPQQQQRRRRQNWALYATMLCSIFDNIYTLAHMFS